LHALVGCVAYNRKRFQEELNSLKALAERAE
jgi:hypothetical protein